VAGVLRAAASAGPRLGARRGETQNAGADPLQPIEQWPQCAVDKLASYLEGDDHDGVGLIEVELAHVTSWTPNDPDLSDQEHYPSIDLEAAWEFSKGNKDIVVQVLDTGIDMAHEDLQLNIWKNAGETDCSDGIDNDNNGFVDVRARVASGSSPSATRAEADGPSATRAEAAPRAGLLRLQPRGRATGVDSSARRASRARPQDTGTDLLGPHWHGTHCGGTVAADTNNGVGVAGVAGGDGTANSGAKLMISVGFGDTNTGGFAEALLYGADMGAQISSNSWGYIAPGVYDQAELDAIARACARRISLRRLNARRGNTHTRARAHTFPRAASTRVEETP